ncbi:MAG: 4Fe-4S binding protein [Pseudomonadota bacterium]
MDEAKLYDQLADYLDQGVVGSPKSPALSEILKVLFPVEDAEVALRLPMQNKTLSDLKAVFSDKPDIEDILSRMVKRGTVFTSQRSGQERKYRLLPSVVGWAETPFWAGKDTPEARKLAPLWLQYRDEAFNQEWARGGMPVMRVLPVSKTIQDPRAVLPFDALKPMIEATSYQAVGHCPCRQIKKYVGDPCGFSTENCLHFGSMGQYMVEQDMARKLTVDETLQILKEANEEGLVHIVDNIEGHVSTICNCCGCCCVQMVPMKQLGLQTLSPSNYVSRVNPEACVGCGTCEERCPMEAIQVGDDDLAVVDESLCIGCGVCTPTCDAEAVDLVLRGEVKSPPKLEEVLAARFKGAE